MNQPPVKAGGLVWMYTLEDYMNSAAVISFKPIYQHLNVIYVTFLRLGISPSSDDWQRANVASLGMSVDRLNKFLSHS